MAKDKLQENHRAYYPQCSIGFLLHDFIVECDMRADNVPPGARYGFIFRAADVRNGGIARYYALMLDPNQSVVAMSWWMDTRWMMNAEQPLPADLLKVGQKSRLTLEASGNRFRAFINEHFVAEFSTDGLKDGRIGLCLSGVNAQPWTVYFGDFQIFLPPGNNPEQSRAAFEISSAPREKPSGPLPGELQMDPWWENLRADPRFQEILFEPPSALCDRALKHQRQRPAQADRLALP